MLWNAMRVIAWNTLVAFYTVHPETKASLTRWRALTKAATWNSMEELKAAFSSAVVLSGERARFEIAGGNYRLIAAYDFRRHIAFVKFIGTHAEYDRVDALTVSQF
jgi:mRNA interferase HigB